ncbi:serine kinase [Kosmotoga arenicorallina S304]|uniref:Serine kinase n=1 Tax=Kosmotoga arenicorallina S304 TaxID=1453497 RepID=A0A176K129_9BACT|nr:homoserine kinase [Kosmotoga arenicorallina]OAA30202.1 serine kinase [Kosmotoga arenicorallina S304]
MGIKTVLSKSDFIKLLSGYSLGELVRFEPIITGTVQTNYYLETTTGRYILRYYECRSEASVKFEVNLLNYLRKRDYPCPAVYKDKHGRYVNPHNGKPYVLFEFIQGTHIENPSVEQQKQLIKLVAKLHKLTRNYRPSYRTARWNYGVNLCKELAYQKAKEINTINSWKKLKWLEDELEKLQLPKSLPKGICHCDFHFSNILFEDGEIQAILDFDDANYTYLLLDLAFLIEPFIPEFKWNSWQSFGKTDSILDFTSARETVAEYMKHRQLNNNEIRHLFDVYKLSVLIDCLWYFERGKAEDFYEKRKIDALNRFGRDSFFREIFDEN